MKKITPAVIAIGIALMLTSCSSGKKPKTTAASVVSSEAVTKALGKESAASSDSETIDYEGKYYLTVNDIKILPGTDFAPILKELKDKYPYTVKKGGTCAGNFPVHHYVFSGGSFSVDANEIKKKQIVDIIYVNDDSIDCGGVYIGQNKEDVKKVYGAPKEETETFLEYVSNGTALDFSFDETGKLMEIRYFVPA